MTDRGWRAVLQPNLRAMPYIGGKISNWIVLREVRVLRILRHLIHIRSRRSNGADRHRGVVEFLVLHVAAKFRVCVIAAERHALHEFALPLELHSVVTTRQSAA